MEDIMLSIYVPVYNHEKYIEQALDSILAQQTNYTYEVLVGEDCSTDNTRNVLKEYENAHPGFLKVIYRDKNSYKYGPILNSRDLKMRARGKYIIGLEGDDYWTDEKKIEKQIRYLENHPECIAVSHNCVVVDQNSVMRTEVYPECLEERYTIKHFQDGLLPGQLATLMYRNVYKTLEPNSILDKRLMVGDTVIAFYLLAKGEIHCIQEKMSAYRYVTCEGDSFSANFVYSFKKSELLYRSLLEFAKEQGNEEIITVAEFCYLKSLMTGVKKKEIGVKELRNYCRYITHKGRVCLKYLVFRVEKDIFRKKTLCGYRSDGKKYVGK